MYLNCSIIILHRQHSQCLWNVCGMILPRFTSDVAVDEKIEYCGCVFPEKYVCYSARHNTFELHQCNA